MDEKVDVVKLNDQSSSSLDYFSNKLLLKKADISIFVVSLFSAVLFVVVVNIHDCLFVALIIPVA